MNPLWIPLLAMLGALGSDAAASPPKAVSGDPLKKTIYDHTRETFGPVIREAQVFLAMHPGAQVEDLIYHLVQRVGGDPMDSNFTAMISLVYSVAKAAPHNSIWKLEPDAYEALVNTAPPWELARNRLPRLPYDGLLVQLPRGVKLPVQILHPVPFNVRISSILVVEDIPGQKWRYIGISDDADFNKVAYSRGWLDLGVASAKAQLLEGKSPDAEMTRGHITTVTTPFEKGVMSYELTGEDKVWQLLLNLFLALEHKHLDGQLVKPKVPRGRQGRRFTKRYSPSEYTVVRLSSASREARKKRKAEAEASTSRKPMRRHLVSGHWRSVWVVDPADKPVFATKPRVGRDGRTLEGDLYKTAVWVFPFWKGSDDGGSPQERKYKVKLG
jgi:hypothetical protein